MAECPNIARDLADERYDRKVLRSDGYVYFMRKLPGGGEMPVQYCRIVGLVTPGFDCGRELFWSRCQFRFAGVTEARD